MQLKQNLFKTNRKQIKAIPFFLSLPRSRCLDVTQRSPKRTFGGALCDIQKKGCEGDYTFLRVVMRWYREVFLIPEEKQYDMMPFYTTKKIHLTFCTMKGREVTKNKTHLQESFDTFIPLVVVNLHFLR